MDYSVMRLAVRATLATAATLAAGAGPLAPLAAQEADRPLRLELNKLEPNGAGCQVYLTARNDSDGAFDALKLDLVVFDADGVVARRLAVDMAPLKPRKTTLKVFAVQPADCAGFGKILLNDIQQCRDGSGERTDCLDLIETTSLADVAFFQ